MPFKRHAATHFALQYALIFKKEKYAMKASQFFISTLKEAPAEAALASHKLMIRAGLIKANASGLYTWMPMGLRVLRKVENIVREEMARAGSVELLMPVVQPAELWQESGRWEFYGKELLRLKDRHDRDFCMGPTCEEVIADIVRKEVNSYKQLPKNFYHIQTKFRDEVRPRFGVMRAREFVMKDAYSFHADYASLQTTYQDMYDAYCRIFTRLGLEFVLLPQIPAASAVPALTNSKYWLKAAKTLLHIATLPITPPISNWHLPCHLKANAPLLRPS